MYIDNLFTDPYQLVLSEIYYKSLPISISPEQVQVNVSDSIDLHRNDNECVITFDRHVSLGNQAYAISVKLESVLSIREDQINTFDEHETELLEELKDSACTITNNMAAKASAIISDITSAVNPIPLVTIPSFISEGAG